MPFTGVTESVSTRDETGVRCGTPTSSEAAGRAAAAAAAAAGRPASTAAPYSANGADRSEPFTAPADPRGPTRRPVTVRAACDGVPVGGPLEGRD